MNMLFYLNYLIPETFPDSVILSVGKSISTPLFESMSNPPLNYCSTFKMRFSSWYIEKNIQYIFSIRFLSTCLQLFPKDI